MAKRRKTKKASAKIAPRKQKNLGLAVVALILNIILPGLGSLIAGSIRAGIWQLVLIVIALVLIISPSIYLPLAVYAIALIWGILTSIALIRRAK